LEKARFAQSARSICGYRPRPPETTRAGVASPTNFELWVSELADENLIDRVPVEEESGFIDTLSDSDLWPAETVFVPTAETPDETPAINETERTQLAFEDEEADDFFEQSLSGLKLSDAEGRRNRKRNERRT
jgi:hypothetical protein